MEVLEINSLTKKFGDFVAVNNVSLSIKEGEIYGFLGPNGAGKTTIINIICGLLQANSGKISILGKDIKKERNETKSNLGIVPQDIAIYESLSAYENIKFFASLYGFRGKDLDKRVKEALEFTSLTDKAKEMPNKFSGGMKRRLNIACAIAHRPKLIIMDEPTVGIDPQSRNHILESVKKLNKMGCTIVYTSHYMEEVEEICTRIVIIDHGKVIAEGTNEELKSTIKNTNNVSITVDSIEKVDKDKIELITGVLNVDIKENIIKINSTINSNNLDKVISYFTENKIPIRNLENEIPNLETVFLSLTGRTLRD